jgi:hypothetical protein
MRKNVLIVMEADGVMIEISNEKAKKIQDLLSYFSSITADMPRSNRLDNSRREAKRITKYINNKKV